MTFAYNIQMAIFGLHPNLERNFVYVIKKLEFFDKESRLLEGFS